MNKHEKEKNFVSAVVYIHDEPAQVNKFLHLIKKTLEDNFLHSEIICVIDDADESIMNIIRQMGIDQGGNVSVSFLKMGSYHGVEMAMTAGVDLAIGDFVFEFDSTIDDFTADTIMEVYRKSLQGYDIVCAVPEKGQLLTSKLFYYIFSKFSTAKLQMVTERFRIISRRAINRISSMNKTVPYRKVVYAGCGFPLYEYSYVPVQGSRGMPYTSEENHYRRRLAIDAMLLFTDVGYRISMFLTSMMMLIAIVTGCYGVVIYVTSSPVSGWTTTICFMAFAFFTLFLILTIIMKYLQLILNLVFKKKQVCFEGVEKITN